jgi:hypothetical protein
MWRQESYEEKKLIVDNLGLNTTPVCTDEEAAGDLWLQGL